MKTKERCFFFLICLFLIIWGKIFHIFRVGWHFFVWFIASLIFDSGGHWGWFWHNSTSSNGLKSGIWPKKWGNVPQNWWWCFPGCHQLFLEKNWNSKIIFQKIWFLSEIFISSIEDPLPTFFGHMPDTNPLEAIECQNHPPMTFVVEKNKKSTRKHLFLSFFWDFFGEKVRKSIKFPIFSIGDQFPSFSSQIPDYNPL